MSVVDKASVTLQFDLRDSCNCCGLIKPKENKAVYVNKQGEIELFSIKKATEDIALIHQRSLQRLRCSLQERVKLITDEADLLQQQLEKESGLHLFAFMRPDESISIGQIKRINQKLHEIELSLKEGK